MLNRLFAKILWSIINFRDDLKSSGKKISNGLQNPDKTFFVIGFLLESEGLMSLVSHAFAPIVYALQKGYIPIIDLQNYPNQYLPKNALGKENSWEYFFEQPCDYTLEDIAESNNIIICVGKYFRRFAKKHLSDIEIQREYFQKYIRPSKIAKEYMDEDYQNIFKPERKILGVLCRGTDYLVGKGFYVPIQPDTPTIIRKADDVLREQNCTHLYLATEDENIYQQFKAYFGEKLLVNRQKRVKQDALDFAGGKRLFEVPMDISAKKQMALAYLSSLNILAHSSCFVGTKSTGTTMLYLMSKGFEYDYVFDLGHYPANIRILFKKHITNFYQKIFHSR